MLHDRSRKNSRFLYPRLAGLNASDGGTQVVIADGVTCWRYPDGSASCEAVVYATMDVNTEFGALFTGATIPFRLTFNFASKPSIEAFQGTSSGRWCQVSDVTISGATIRQLGVTQSNIAGPISVRVRGRWK